MVHSVGPIYCYLLDEGDKVTAFSSSRWLFWRRAKKNLKNKDSSGFQHKAAAAETHTTSPYCCTIQASRIGWHFSVLTPIPILCTQQHKTKKKKKEFLLICYIVGDTALAILGELSLKTLSESQTQTQTAGPQNSYRPRTWPCGAPSDPVFSPTDHLRGRCHLTGLDNCKCRW